MTIVGMDQTGGAAAAMATDMRRTMATMVVTWCGSASGMAMAGGCGPFRSAADYNPVRQATPPSSCSAPFPRGDSKNNY